MKQRLDLLVVERGLAGSREKAQALILAGAVRVDGQRVDKPGRPVDDAARIDVLERMPYVSRGGFKLAAALDHFRIDVGGRVCADIGSSTGGFTDCLLQRGAARVHCVDVGEYQLDWTLRNDPRVVVHEKTNARYLSPETIGELCSFLCCDVSFISVTLLAPVFPLLLDETGRMVILVKPQFEVGRGLVGRGGIVTDPALRQAACDRVRTAVAALGFETDIMECPLPGMEGNREFLLYGYRGARPA